MKKAELKVVVDDLDRIFNSMLRGLGKPEVKRQKSAQFVKYQRRRHDGLYELLSIQVETLDGILYLYIQLGVHCFSECPIPSGPFGFDGNVLQIARESGMIFPDKMLFGESLVWDSDSSVYLERMQVELRTVLVRRCDEWAAQLISDPILVAAVSFSNQIRESGSLSAADVEHLLKGYGATTLQGYPISKVANQAFRHGIGDPSWRFI